MSTIDPEESMRQMVEGLDWPDPDPTVSVSLLDEQELIKRFKEVEQELLEMGEMLHPKSVKARDLHSTRAAYLIELKKRGMR